MLSSYPRGRIVLEIGSGSFILHIATKGVEDDSRRIEKKLINLSSNDSIVYKRNDERVEPQNTDTVASISATGDWDGFVQYNVELG